MGNNEIIQYNTVADAIRYLTSMAWQVSDKSFYRHIQQGKIGAKPWTKNQLDEYAASYLRPAVSAVTTKAKKSGHVAAHELIEARKKKINIEIDLKSLELEQKKDLYIEKVDHVRMVCAKMQLVKDAAFNWIREYAKDMIVSCNGDLARQDQLIEQYQESFLRYIERLDTPAEFPILGADDFGPEILE